MIKRLFWLARIEAAWKKRSIDHYPKNLKTFRKHYPVGENFVVSLDVDQPFTKKVNGLTVRFLNLSHLILLLKKDTEY